MTSSPKREGDPPRSTSSQERRVNNRAYSEPLLSESLQQQDIITLITPVHRHNVSSLLNSRPSFLLFLFTYLHCFLPFLIVAFRPRCNQFRAYYHCLHKVTLTPEGHV